MKKFALALVLITSFCGAAGSTAWAAAKPWPPVVGKAYPDLELRDADGRSVKLSSFKGSVIIVEPIGMTCKACQAFSGAQERGGYGGIKPQSGLDSIAKYFERFTNGLSLEQSGLVFIQVIFYDLSVKPPSADDARKWARHFGLDSKPNHHVLYAPKELISDVSYKMIPGFQLIDKDFVLVSDSTGHAPKNDLYQHLLPKARSLLVA